MSSTSAPAPASEGRKPRRRSRLPLILGGLALLLLAAVVVWWFFLRAPDNTEPYRTEAVTRGDLTRTVSASGTLQALVTVNVGSQLSGQVRQVLVDFNDHVRRGQVLAVLDPSTFASRVAQGQSDVAAASAQVGQQQAQVRQAEADAELARVQYQRQERLRAAGFAAPTAVDQARAAYNRAVAAVNAARSGVTAQQARVGQSRASLGANAVDLARTRIVAPIDGVIIDRQVEPGQTVAASLNVATLFTIAQDLSLVQVKINVPEADIGEVHEGQSVRFTVDAFPDQVFTGNVVQVRQQPVTENNVVSYVVLANAANTQNRLMPGMTANADIVVETLSDVVKVPSAALRFTPADQQARPRGGGGLPGLPGAGGGGQGGRGGQGGGRGGGGQFITRMFEDVHLDAQQQQRVTAIMTRAREQARSGSDPNARRQAMSAAMDQIAPIIRPEQRAAFEQVRARMAQGGGGNGRGGGGQRGTVWVLRNNQPTPISVRVLGTDGSLTAVRARELNAGDQVIIGGGPRAPAQLPSGGGRGGGGGGRGGGIPRGL